MIVCLNCLLTVEITCVACRQHCRVLIHDMRSPSPLVMSLKGHDNVVTDVQMDGWKVASGRCVCTVYAVCIADWTCLTSSTHPSSSFLLSPSHHHLCYIHSSSHFVTILHTHTTTFRTSLKHPHPHYYPHLPPTLSPSLPTPHPHPHYYPHLTPTPSPSLPTPHPHSSHLPHTLTTPHLPSSEQFGWHLCDLGPTNDLSVMAEQCKVQTLCTSLLFPLGNVVSVLVDYKMSC